MGVIVWLASELMFFAALFAAYFTIRNVTATTAPQMWHDSAAMLNVPFALTNTAILVLSSITCQMGVFAAEHGRVARVGRIFNPAKWGMREWYILTFIMGAIFISGQMWEYANLLHEGLAIYSNVYGSVFYLATGFHGLHVTGGLIAFLLLLGRTYMTRRFTHEQAVNAIAVSYYWHFVDVVWIILFGVIYIIK